MSYRPSAKELCQVIDCFNHLWNVTDSRPTKHSWNVLLGFPVDNGRQSKVMGPARVILTAELCAYLKEFRMNPGKVQLPLSSNVVRNLRRKLGMDYLHDCRQWWEETKSAVLSGTTSPENMSSFKAPNLTWKREEILQFGEMLKSGVSLAKIARILGRSEKVIQKLHKRLFGLQKPNWSAEEQKELLAAFGKNVPFKEIAKKVNRSQGAIEIKLTRMRNKNREALAMLSPDPAPHCVLPGSRTKRFPCEQSSEPPLPGRKVLCQVTDYAGHLWDVVESRPTEHGWNVFLGFLAGSEGKRGSPKTILTTELRDYLELHRMNLSAICLPVTPCIILRLRKELGMNYVKDCKLWWADAKQEAFTPAVLSSAQWGEAHLTPQKTWTKEELRQLMELIVAGKKTHEIAAIMNKTIRSVDTVRRRLLGVRIKMQRWSEQDEETLVTLRKQGASTQEIARVLGSTTERVQRKVALLIPPDVGPKRIWTDEEEQKFRELAAVGHTVKEIAAALDRTPDVIHRRWPKVVGKRKTGPKKNNCLPD